MGRAKHLQLPSAGSASLFSSSLVILVISILYHTKNAGTADTGQEQWEKLSAPPAVSDSRQATAQQQSSPGVSGHMPQVRGGVITGLRGW